MPLYLVAIGLAAVLAGGVAAISGFGIGSILTPLVAIAYGTKVAVLLVAVPHFIATALRFVFLWRDVDRGVLLTFGAASAGGGLAGALLGTVLSSRVLGITLGVLLVVAGVAGLTGLSGRLRIASGAWAVTAGVLSGGFGGLVGNQGGLRSAALLHFHLPATTTVATATGVGLAVDLARIPVYLASGGAEILANWPLVSVLAVGGVAGTLLLTPVLRRIPEGSFRGLVFGLITLLGVAMLAGVGG